MGYHYITLHPVQSEVIQAILRIEACVDELRQWMTSNFLKFNDGKTELMIIGSKHQRAKVNIPGIRVGGDIISPSDTVRNLGIVFDSNLSMESHISAVSRETLA